MTPAQARAWIAGLEIFGMRFGTERMVALLAALDDPHRHAAALHVVGTNGKSSTTRLAAAALGTAGRRVGAYVSPHVTEWHERVQVDGAPVAPEAFAAAVARVRAAAERLELPAGDAVTQFEAVTAAAFCAFRDAGVEVCAVEAGLGGRYDATNVLAPDAAVVLTNVSLDHTDLLGDTEAAIAAEKLAVCAEGHARLVVGRCAPGARAAVAAEARRRRLTAEWVGKDVRVRPEPGGTVAVLTPRATYEGVALGLAGDFQRDNLAAAVAGAELVAGGPLDAAALGPAVASVRMPGRLEWVDGAPPVLLDGAHNPAGVAALVDALPGLAGERRPRVAVVSVLADKDADAMLAALAPAVDAVVATVSTHPRALPAGRVAQAAARAGIAVHRAATPADALAHARERSGAGGLVVIAGSLYLLLDLRPAVVG